MTAGLKRCLCMSCFVAQHFFDNGSAFDVIDRQFVQMCLQMVANLIFGGSDKPKAKFIADQAGTGTNPKGHGIPDWV
jgi:hypothetical protein